MNIEAVKDKYQSLDKELTGNHNLDDSLAIFYHENSKIDKSMARRQLYQINLFNSPYLAKRASKPYKNYLGEAEYSLKEYTTAQPPSKDIYKILERRSSTRAFQKGYDISLSELQKILHYSYGISRTTLSNDGESTWASRHVPSAGGLYPLEIYVVILNGMIEKGVYHYNAHRNSLTLIKRGDFLDELNQCAGAKPWVDLETACCVVVTTAFFERQMIKYGERAYRFVLMETGYVAQNMSIICEGNDLGSCMLGFFYDDQLNELLGIPGFGESCLNVMVIGKKQTD